MVLNERDSKRFNRKRGRLKKLEKVISNAVFEKKYYFQSAYNIKFYAKNFSFAFLAR